MIGYVLHERGLGEDYEFYDVSLPYIFLNKKNRFILSFDKNDVKIIPFNYKFSQI